MLLQLLKTIAIILLGGLAAEKIMEKFGKGQDVRNINYYLRQGNSLPASIAKAFISGYVWIYKVYIKALFLFLLSMLGGHENQKTQEQIEAEIREQEYFDRKQAKKWK